jgi:sirohydrochlorin cobaltochelatase
VGGLQKMTGISSSGIVLFAHGSRDPLWSKPIEAIAAAISVQSPGSIVRCAYLELMSPSLEDVAAALTGQGLQSIRIVPMFLGVGKHAREDLPEIVESLKAAYPSVKFELTPSIGEHPDLIAAIAEIVTKRL